MTNPAGTRWAQTVAEFLMDHGWPHAERRAQRGTNDAGDIAGVLGWHLECKATKDQDLPGALNQARDSVAKAITKAARRGRKMDPPFVACIFKRRNHVADRAYVVMELEPWTKLLRMAGYGQAPGEPPPFPPLVISEEQAQTWLQETA